MAKPTVSADVFILSMPVNTVGMEPLPSQGPIYANGPDQPPTPTRRLFLKDLITTGDYEHPVHHWKLATDPKRMDKWVAAFGKMQAAGVKVPIYADHEPAAENTLGYLDGVFRGSDFAAALTRYPELAKLPTEKLPTDPNTLYGIHEFADGDSQNLANRVGQVSVLIDRNMVDGSGNEYGEAIRHVAVTPEPIVNGQGDFVQLAASRNSDAPAVYVLGIERSTHKVEEPPMKVEDLKKLQDLLGEDGKDLTDENAASKICDHVTGLTKRLSALEKAAEKKMAASTLTPDAEDVLVESAEAGLDGLVTAGNLLPCSVTALKEILIGKPGARNAYTLSRSVSGTEESMVRGIVKALKMNDPIKLGEQTKQQTIALSRITPGTEKVEDDPKVAETMVNMVGGTK
jgi:hypothetical protein